jgi:hypothetical protein
MQGHIVPESFTHGTSEQRKYWFMKGYKTEINKETLLKLDKKQIKLLKIGIASQFFFYFLSKSQYTINVYLR